MVRIDRGCVVMMMVMMKNENINEVDKVKLWVYITPPSAPCETAEHFRKMPYFYRFRYCASYYSIFLADKYVILSYTYTFIVLTLFYYIRFQVGRKILDKCETQNKTKLSTSI